MLAVARFLIHWHRNETTSSAGASGADAGGRVDRRSHAGPVYVNRMSPLIANGKPVEARLPCTLEEFLVAQGLPPRSVVVEHNGEAVAPSEFAGRPLNAGDRLEIVKIVAGG
jgi:sulfur carrier protein